MQMQFYGIILLVGAYFRYSDTSSWESNNTIIADISKAFLKITNETDALSKLIPEMYNLNVTDPPFVFKLPHKDGAVLLIKRRSDFLDPQFPNLTTSNMQLVNERKHTELISSESQRRNPQYIHLDDLEVTGTSDVWREMGLAGWSGEISEQIEFPDLHEMNGQHFDENHYSSETSKDLNLEPFRSNLMRDSGPRSNMGIRGTTEMIMMTESEVMERDEGERVYLARVNDPFGYSTSWELRNSSEFFDNEAENRPKRDVVRLYSMIKCSTGCEPLLFQGYGCYCGFLGAGFPVDDIDRCCKLHDKCYEHSNCISYLEYFVPYIWKCYRGKPLCAVDHGEWGSPRSCAARLCYCDMRLSRCLRKFECPRNRAGCKSSPVRQLHRFLFP